MSEDQLSAFLLGLMCWACIAMTLAAIVYRIHFGKKGKR